MTILMSPGGSPIVVLDTFILSLKPCASLAKHRVLITSEVLGSGLGPSTPLSVCKFHNGLDDIVGGRTLCNPQSCEGRRRTDMAKVVQHGVKITGSYVGMSGEGVSAAQHRSTVAIPWRLNPY